MWVEREMIEQRIVKIDFLPQKLYAELCHFRHFHLPRSNHPHFRTLSRSVCSVQCSYYHITWQKYIYTVIHFVWIFMFISITHTAVWPTVNYLIFRRSLTLRILRSIDGTLLFFWWAKSDGTHFSNALPFPNQLLRKRVFNASFANGSKPLALI